MQVTWEFDLTLYRVDRDVYSILDWIGDVGGLSEGLVIGLGAVLAFLNFKHFEHFLIEQLFWEKDDRITWSRKEKLNSLNVNKTSIFRQKINGCCKMLWNLNREERLFAKARSYLDDEIDIVKFLRKIRRIEAFEKELTQKYDLDTDKMLASEYKLIEVTNEDNNDHFDHPSPLTS